MQLLILVVFYLCIHPIITAMHEPESVPGRINHVHIIAFYKAIDLSVEDGKREGSGIVIDSEHILASAHALYKKNDTEKSRQHRLRYEEKPYKLEIYSCDGVKFETNIFDTAPQWKDDATSYEESRNYDIGIIFFPKKSRFRDFYSIEDVEESRLGQEPDKLTITVSGYSSHEGGPNFYTRSGKGECHPDPYFFNLIRYKIVTYPGISGGAVHYSKQDRYYQVKQSILGLHSGNFLNGDGGASVWNGAVRMNEDIQNTLCCMKDEYLWQQLNVDRYIYGEWRDQPMPVILIAQGRCVEQIKNYWQQLDSILWDTSTIRLNSIFSICIGSDACADFVCDTFFSFANGPRVLTTAENSIIFDSNDSNEREEKTETLNEIRPINMKTFDPTLPFFEKYENRSPIVLALPGEKC